jgi:hypothetical protein
VGEDELSSERPRGRAEELDADEGEWVSGAEEGERGGVRSSGVGMTMRGVRRE